VIDGLARERVLAVTEAGRDRETPRKRPRKNVCGRTRLIAGVIGSREAEQCARHADDHPQPLRPQNTQHVLLITHYAEYFAKVNCHGLFHIAFFGLPKNIEESNVKLKCLNILLAYISAALFPDSVTAEAYAQAVTRLNDIVVCDYSIDEMQRVFSKKFPASLMTLRHFMITWPMRLK
jgi:hypothetical protein